MPEEVAAKMLTFEVERDGSRAVVTCHGRLVSGATDDFYQEVKKMMPDTKQIVVDLADLTYVDSMGLGTLVRLYVSARERGCEFKLLHLGKQLRNLLKMTNLMAVFGEAEEHNITVA